MVPWVPEDVDHHEAKAPWELSQHQDLASPAIDTVADGSLALQTSCYCSTGVGCHCDLLRPTKEPFNFLNKMKPTKSSKSCSTSSLVYGMGSF